MLRGAAAALAAAMLLAGCGGNRSPEAYCEAFYAKAAPMRQAIVDQNERIEEDPLGSIVALMSAPGDLVSIFDAMVDHAPDEIKSDTVVARDAFKKLQDSLGENLDNPLKALGSSLMAGVTSLGAMNRVDAYLGEHCPVNSDLAQRFIREAAGD